MTGVVDLKEARLDMAARRGFRNWRSRFKEDFGRGTFLGALSLKTLATLAQGKESSTFYLFDLIMNIEDLGSGFEFNELPPKQKIGVMDRYLFLLDRIRFEYMKRLGWLEGYPGEDMGLVDLVVRFDQLAPRLQADTPSLSRDHPSYERFSRMKTLEREEFIRKMIPKALQKMGDHSTTL
ncbi:MAG: hypothetical protein JW821_05590 [Deltaproteobacteria bacterium]|nr:hypothetical protein [Deltaproteobacteria bacterium]